jgi:hypothetical protein
MRLPASVPNGHPLRRSAAELRDLLDTLRAEGRRDGHDDRARARAPRDHDDAEFLARTWILGLCAFDDEDIAPLCAAYLAAYRDAYADHCVWRSRVQTGPPRAWRRGDHRHRRRV